MTGAGEPEALLEAHASSATGGAPGHLVRSVFTDRHGMPILGAGASLLSKGFVDAAKNYAGKVLDATARLLGVSMVELDAMAATAESGSRGLALLPYFDGERTPNLPHASGWISGMRSDVSRADLARAAIEGVVCSLLDALDARSVEGVGAGGLVEPLGLGLLLAGLDGERHVGQYGQWPPVEQEPLAHIRNLEVSAHFPCVGQYRG